MLKQPTIKTYADWKGNLSEYLQIGDVVDQEMVDYFINVLPPATMNSQCVQMGEPYSSVQGRMTYCTLKKLNGQWVYAGYCWKGQTSVPLESLGIYGLKEDNK